MTHMHVAGVTHADVWGAGPQWLERPTDPNALDTQLWSSTTRREPSGEVTIGGLGVTGIVEQTQTPVYVMDEVDFRARAAAFRQAFADWDVYYAGKALLTRSVARWAMEEGLRLDVCSLGELVTALRAGVPAADIGLHGNNKSVEELRLAIEQGVGRIVVDSLDEVARIERLTEELDLTAHVMVRVTVGVEAHTHEYIATAHEDQKFGFSIANGAAMVAMVRCHYNPRIDLRGIHSHIGSQIFATQGFEVAARRTMKLLGQFVSATGSQLPELDLGGGFGIRYTSQDSPATPDQLASDLREIVEHESRAFGLTAPRMSIEPGRAIVGPAGTALYTVGTVKTVELDGGQSRVYVSVDGGMSDNIRTALYAAEYSAALVNRASTAQPVLCRVVGKHCEAGDIVVRDVFLPGDITPGDLIGVPANGAYSRSMASNYNHATKPPVVAVRDGHLVTMLRRETLDDLLGLDVGA
ncbi:diaminopimelate decarboxylase [Aestuariimicrobium sp. T2.26MG-19.2B]|uniref:diaminopimelate decarboxylase n=1 Tax=Aestuariimicrobium sp. T2.26MG-19.2B TaxID=3040679 RepID=UPI002477B3EA|nr:diaminopimelate decarboxylase [Aestuariimicrobium sp. T2.26MG-19.2B]CAI9410479.1 Diaminopimelate decarboxylase [Aestuariimicrobium sp. T2.26MG-19.2B]